MRPATIIATPRNLLPCYSLRGHCQALLLGRLPFDATSARIDLPGARRRPGGLGRLVPTPSGRGQSVASVFARTKGGDDRGDGEQIDPPSGRHIKRGGPSVLACPSVAR